MTKLSNFLTEQDKATLAREAYSELLSSLIGRWIDEISTPEFRAYKRKRIAITLDFDDPYIRHDEIGDYDFDEDITKQHELLMAWLSISQSLSAMDQCKYYLRRYPFRELPVTMGDHARNIIEMYFNTVYMMKERLKLYLNLHKKMYPNTKIEIGRAIKDFERHYAQELKERNGVHHHSQFEDIALDRLLLAELISRGEDQRAKSWSLERQRYYRLLCKEWIERIETRTKQAEKFINSLAGRIIIEAEFLHKPKALAAK